MHLMIDLETLSTLPDAPILQIGVVAFDPQGLGYGTAVRLDVDPQSCFVLGLRPDWGAIRFWMSQAKRQSWAAEHIMDGDTVNVFDALADLRDICEAVRPEGVWSHGAGFDLPILRTAFALLGEETPWSYRAERCVRTLLRLADEARPGWQKEAPMLQGLDGEAAHDALADARIQALKVQAAMKAVL